MFHACRLIVVLVIALPGARATSQLDSIDVRHYAFRLELRDDSDSLRGTARVTARFVEPGVRTIALDLVGRKGAKGMSVAAVERDGRSLAFAHTEDVVTITLASAPEAGEERTFEVTYEGVPADGLVISKNTHGERTFFGDNWPERARHWLPCVDDVADKATVEFIVDAPQHYQVVANGLLREETDLPGGLRRTHWATSRPLPTKVMVIGVARFAVQYVGEANGVPIQSWVYPQSRDEGFSDFARAVNIVEVLARRLGPFPYAKLANVQSTTRYGGMENASAVFYGERTVAGDGSNEGLIAHEIAHQWFGDSVTEASWHHVWLSEGFATYLTQVYMEDVYGRERLVEGMRSAGNRIFRFQRMRPDATVVATDISEPTSLLNALSYQKGAWVLHMLRREVGDDVFWHALRSFYLQYRDGNATTGDLQALVEGLAGQDLAWFFEQWTGRPGHPKVEATWRWDEVNGRLHLDLRQTQETGHFRFPLDIEVRFGEGAPPHRFALDVRARTVDFMMTIDREPVEIVLDPDAWVLLEADVRRQ